MCKAGKVKFEGKGKLSLAAREFQGKNRILKLGVFTLAAAACQTETLQLQRKRRRRWHWQQRETERLQLPAGTMSLQRGRHTNCSPFLKQTLPERGTMDYNLYLSS